MVFLDANILLELLLPGRREQQAAADALARLSSPTCVSMLTVHLVLHFGRLAGVPDSLLHQALARHTVLPLTAEDYTWAISSEQGHDFEDALQVAVAVRSGCDSFITLDRVLAKRYANTLAITTP